jgi:hypothetical protein
MRFLVMRSLPVAVLGVLLGGCGPDEALEPTNPESFAAARADGTLATPTNLIATVQAGNRIRLSWSDNSSNEKGFELLRSPTGASGVLQLYVGLAAGATAYVDTEVHPSSTYCYAVRAFKLAGGTKSYSLLSATACVTTPPAAGAPLAPSGVAAISRNSSTILVSWTDNSQDETGFQLERAPDRSGAWLSVATLASSLTSTLDGGRLSETQACYRVAAFNANGRSSWSEAACSIPPRGPTDLRVIAATSTSVDLTWSDNSAFEDGYEVQRAAALEGPYSAAGTLAVNATTFHQVGLEPEHTYWYQVRAKGGGGYSDLAGPIPTATATTLPAAPAWVSASPSPDASNMHLHWADNSANESGFRLERSVAGAAWVTRMTFGPGAAGASDVTHYPTQVPTETEICYRVIAFNALGESSDTLCTGLPAVPVDLSARLVEGAVELSWTDNSRFEDGVYIVRADDTSMGFYYIYDAVGPNVSTYRDEHPEGWGSYYLRAIKGTEGYTTCCSNAVDVLIPSPGAP